MAAVNIAPGSSKEPAPVLSPVQQSAHTLIENMHARQLQNFSSRLSKEHDHIAHSARFVAWRLPQVLQTSSAPAARTEIHIHSQRLPLNSSCASKTSPLLNTAC
jgi:hypothetical protein